MFLNDVIFHRLLFLETLIFCTLFQILISSIISKAEGTLGFVTCTSRQYFTVMKAIKNMYVKFLRTILEFLSIINLVFIPRQSYVTY